MHNRMRVLTVILGLLIIGLFFMQNKKSITVVAPMVSYNATTTYTVIDMNYPESSEKKYPEIYNAIRNIRTEFEGQFASLTDEEILAQYGREDVEFQLFVRTRVATSTKTVSYILEVYQYTGGAHGGTLVKTFTYDYAGKLLELTDILDPGYLQVIAPLAREYAYANFSEMSQPRMIDDGTAPRADNYSSWYVTDTHIVFIFGQYQIGPYAMGIQEFPLERSKISDILRPLYK